MRAAMDPWDLLSVIPAVDFSEGDLPELRDFLLKHWDSSIDQEGRLNSAMTKAVCVYDVLRYGPANDWRTSQLGTFS